MKTTIRIIILSLGIAALFYLFYYDWRLGLAISIIKWADNIDLTIKLKDYKKK